MSQPARLPSSLLARKGQAYPAGGQAQAGLGASHPVPPVAPVTRQPRRPDNLRSLQTVATTAARRSDGPKTARDGRVALTVKLDPTRHARLRILAARQHRTSQDVMIEALDRLLEACECMRNRAGGNRQT